MSSFRYQTVKNLMKLAGIRRWCRAPLEEIIAAARRAEAFAGVPGLHDPALDISVEKYQGQKVVMMRHKEKREHARVCLYLIGRGMIFYPKKDQVRQAVRIAKETGRDVFVPYYPLCVDAPVTKCYEWLLSFYEKMLGEYDPLDTAFAGSSSGGSLALGMISAINMRSGRLPMPERVYAASPGECFSSDEIRKKAENLKKSDFLLDPEYMKTEEAILSHGRRIPEFMLYQDKGSYRGLSKAYICFARDEVLYALCGPISKKLIDDGVDVKVEIGDDLFHCYPFSTEIPEARRGWDNMISFLRA
jgi:monoterpene epsilon-lactone hydrolase